MRQVYADNAATTRPDPEVLAAMRPWLDERFGNASSPHRRGEEARDAVEEARGEVARLIGAQPEEIVFTATGSESIALALQGAWPLLPAGRRRVVVSAIEHRAVLENARHLECLGAPLTVVPVRPNGVIDREALLAALGPDVGLVSVMAVNNETGVVQPVEEVGAWVRDCGARYHVDAVQAAGKCPISVDAWQADLVSLAGHKFHGPPGASALFVRRGMRLEPLVRGGSHERGRRAGTHDVPAIVGLGVAAIRARHATQAGPPGALAALGERLLMGLLGRVRDTSLNGDVGARAPGFVNVCFAGVDGEAVLHELDRTGIAVSTGAACSAGDEGPSHVLLAMGLSPEDAHASVRFSLGTTNDADDVDAILGTVPGIVDGLRARGVSPVERSA